MCNNEKFDYTYSAPTENERREIESIRKQYYQPTKSVSDDKLQQLRNLNKRATRLPLVISILLGIIGILVLGVGMTMTMQWGVYVWGAIVGCVGIAVCIANYFVYKAVLKKRKARYSEQIITLSNELLNEKE